MHARSGLWGFVLSGYDIGWTQASVGGKEADPEAGLPACREGGFPLGHWSLIEVL